MPDTTIHEQIDKYLQRYQQTAPDDGDSEVAIIESFGERARHAMPVLAESLPKKDTRIGMAVASAMLQIDPSNEQALDYLLGVIANTSDVGLQEDAAWRIQYAGNKGKKAIPAILRCLKGPHPSTRRNLALSLSNIIEPTDSQAITSAVRRELLEVLRNDPDEEVRASSAFALASLKEQASEAVSAIIAWVGGLHQVHPLGEGVDSALYRSIHALALLAGCSEEALEAYGALFASTEAAKRKAARSHLKRIADPSIRLAVAQTLIQTLPWLEDDLVPEVCDTLLLLWDVLSSEDISTLEAIEVEQLPRSARDALVALLKTLPRANQPDAEDGENPKQLVECHVSSTEAGTTS